MGREGPDESLALFNFEGLLGMAFEGAMCPVLSYAVFQWISGAWYLALELLTFNPYRLLVTFHLCAAVPWKPPLD